MNNFLLFNFFSFTVYECLGVFFDVNFVVYKSFIYYLNNFYANILINILILLFFWNNNIYIILFGMQWLLSYTFYKSFSSYSFFCQIHEFPSTLVIGQVLIHPALFYFSIISFILYCSQKYKVNLLFFYYIRFIFFTTSLTLMLGSWWGWSLAIWGFYWVYDFIEILLLIVIVLLVLNKHKKFSYYLYNFLYTIIWVLCILSLRFGFINTRHSFFNKNSFFFIHFFFIFFIQLLFNSNTKVIKLNINMYNIFTYLLYFMKNIIIFIILKLILILLLILFYYGSSFTMTYLFFFHLIFYYFFSLFLVQSVNYSYYIKLKIQYLSDVRFVYYYNVISFYTSQTIQKKFNKIKFLKYSSLVYNNTLVSIIDLFKLSNTVSYFSISYNKLNQFFFNNLNFFSDFFILVAYLLLLIILLLL